MPRKSSSEETGREEKADVVDHERENATNAPPLGPPPGRFGSPAMVNRRQPRPQGSSMTPPVRGSLGDSTTPPIPEHENTSDLSFSRRPPSRQISEQPSSTTVLPSGGVAPIMGGRVTTTRNSPAFSRVAPPSSKKSSFIPPKSIKPKARGLPTGDSESSFGQALLPPRSTRAFESRVQTSLVAIPEDASPNIALEDAGPDGASPTRGNRKGRTKPYLPAGGASTIAGLGKTVRLSVVPIANGQTSEKRNLSFTPQRLLDIENGISVVVAQGQSLDRNRYYQIDAGGEIVVPDPAAAPFALEDSEFFQRSGPSLQDKIRSGTIHDLEHDTAANTEVVGLLGWMWRAALRNLIMYSIDSVNGMRLSRALQLFLPFSTGYESYLLGQLIESLDTLGDQEPRKSDIAYTFSVAFRNRNVSRIIVQQMGPRFDFIWHIYHAISWNRQFDAFGQVPFIGITSFPATENFPSTRNHALASIFRVLLGEGNWITRVVTQGREGLVTTGHASKTKAQNLAAESNGFELANRNQYGTYFGRQKTNGFRDNHRLPVDESLIRTFVDQPSPTMLNNGIVHVLRQLVKHWDNMLYQFSGNFAHQRMEQLDPFETLRFHMPAVLMTLSSLRGRNKWDTTVLGPFVRRLQQVKPSWNGNSARALVQELITDIIVPVSAGVASVVDPFTRWCRVIFDSIGIIEKEAQQVYDVVTSVEVGIRLGHDLATQVNWKIASDKELKEAILNHIHGKDVADNVSERKIRTALNSVTPRDKRTFIELVQKGMANSEPAKLLLARTATLLQRELRREVLGDVIRRLSHGDIVTEFVENEWYWLEDSSSGKQSVYTYGARVGETDKHRFAHVDTKQERFVSASDGATVFRSYIPVAEAVSRAQRAFMTIELDHGKRFSYGAFMEFTTLRLALRRLVVISQLNCAELDNARLNVLAEIQRSIHTQVHLNDLISGQTYYKYDEVRKTYEPFACEKAYTKSDPEFKQLGRSKFLTVPPQSILVIGGGPTGLMSVIHCLENVLLSGGIVKLYEARDAFEKGGSTYERAQIVRLDARWIAMLRYHLGTDFEDVYIPASGETDSQLGNTLPSQGFVEITIKDLESMLSLEISKMWAKNLIQVYTDSRSNYDPESNTLTKEGQYLKTDDRILRKFDSEGKRSDTYSTWKVVDLEYTPTLSLGQLRVGEQYGVYTNRLESAVLPCTLVGVDIERDEYNFKPLDDGKPTLTFSATNLPTVYSRGVTRHAAVENVVMESVQKSASSGGYIRQKFPMKEIQKQRFSLDVGDTHVVEAIGKPHGSKVHFSATTYEPYGVCCIQGLKISWGMHNFGETRWGSGILDDIRSVNDQNTRVIGDFTKMVRSEPIAVFMRDAITDRKDKNWQTHFDELVKNSKFPDLHQLDPIVPKIQAACTKLAEDACTFRRQTLQTRFFETGDNYYIGMEFTREYDVWKNKLADNLVDPLSVKTRSLEGNAAESMKKDIGRFRGLLTHHIDRLWYDGVLEVIRKGDVYNPGARHRVPRIYVINSYTDQKLGSLPVGESFRLSSDSKDKYEVMIKRGGIVVVRNVDGLIFKKKNSTLVKREGNLTRSPDGNHESKVSLATFPVGHYVNHRTMRLSDVSKGYTFAFIGDEQATPHFMRYSGLTGACINAMLFNNFIKQAIDGTPFIDRFRLYSVETNWSNGEVVQRGTTANYGDGFLRPGFSYDHGLDYLHSKLIEYRESDQDLHDILSRDWKTKFAASMVPRGLEECEDFLKSLVNLTQQAVFKKFVQEVKKDRTIYSKELEEQLESRYQAMSEYRKASDYESFWNDYIEELNVSSLVKKALEDNHIFIAQRLDQTCNKIIDFAREAHFYDNRIHSEMIKQPKSVDSIVDDFAVEAQNFANSFTQSAAFSSGALAFSLVGAGTASIIGALLAAFNIFISFGTMTEVSRYKIRNEEARIVIQDEKMQSMLKGVFSAMDVQHRMRYPPSMNPFVEHLEKQIDAFYKGAKYYNYEEPTEFTAAFEQLKLKINDPSAIRNFQEILTTRFIADVYQVNSYVQEYLVNIYKTLEDMRYLLTQNVNRTSSGDEARQLFDRLRLFREQLEDSLQRGPTRFGFLKQRRVTQWDIIVVFKYFWGLFCCAPRSGSPPLAPISTKTLSLLRQCKHLSAAHKGKILRRELRDLETLYWATRESDIASLMFMTAFMVFFASIFFTVVRIVNTFVSIDVWTNATFWATIPSTFGAILAGFHLVRKFFILADLYSTLGRKARNSRSSSASARLYFVRRVTGTQLILTITRLLSAVAATVALPWSVYLRATDDDVGLPFWIALGAVGAAIFSTLFFLVVEYVIRYNLSPKLGQYICESFRGEIMHLYNKLKNPPKNLTNPPCDVETEPRQVQERECWEYVAREFLHKYRFDAVFAADRFGSILQYIQSGMEIRD